MLLLNLFLKVSNANAAVKPSAPQGIPTATPVVVGPVALNGTTQAAAATITANALGSGVNGPLTAQDGLLINITKDNWWTGGKTGEIDGMNIMLRQNAPHSDASGILIDAQNQGNGFLSATEFSSTIVDPKTNSLTYGIDVQEGVLDKLNGDYIGAVYSAEFGALSTGVLIQNSPGSSWKYAIQYQKDGAAIFSVDGQGNIIGASVYLGGVGLNQDGVHGSIDLGNLSNSSATPYLNFNGFGSPDQVKLINDAKGQLTITTSTGGNLQVKEGGVYTTGSYHLNLSTPASHSPCTTGEIGADANFVYVCVSTNNWKRSALSSY